MIATTTTATTAPLRRPAGRTRIALAAVALTAAVSTAGLLAFPDAADERPSVSAAPTASVLHPIAPDAVAGYARLLEASVDPQRVDESVLSSVASTDAAGSGVSAGYGPSGRSWDDLSPEERLTGLEGLVASITGLSVPS